MRWLQSNVSSKDIIDILQKGNFLNDTKMFKNDLFIKRNRYYEQKWDTVVIIQKRKNIKGQYYCEPDLEIEVFLGQGQD